MTQKSRYFATVFEAVAFHSGLQTASDGSIHHVELKQLPPDNPTGFVHAVTWTDEDSDARRLQQEPHKVMTPQEYVREHKGECCPVCGGGDYEGDSIDFPEAGIATQKAWCLDPDCDSTWYRAYEISGYELKN